MIKYLAIWGIFMSSITSCSAKEADFSLFHYNIKELDSSKLHPDNLQILALKEVLKNEKFDILSINEIQYDLPSVPNPEHQTKGENLNKLATLLGLSDLKASVFYPANTGKNAKTKPDGTYYTLPWEAGARESADQVNFGIFPGQYSTGALFKFKKEQVKVYTDIAWKLVNPDIALDSFQDANGNDYPKDMSLFDKNFTDVTLNIKGKQVHLILFHAVPSFNFGNAKGLNIERNRDQMRFLQWYLTGKTDIEIAIPGVEPLAKDDYFVAVGDWNIDPNKKDSVASGIIRDLFKELTPWVALDKLSFTSESSHFGPDPYRFMLDYIVASKNIEIVSGEIIHPEMKREELGCDNKEQDFHPTDDMIVIEYRNGRKECKALINTDYYNFKTASDHYPLRAKFRFK